MRISFDTSKKKTLCIINVVTVIIRETRGYLWSMVISLKNTFSANVNGSSYELFNTDFNFTSMFQSLLDEFRQHKSDCVFVSI